MLRAREDSVTVDPEAYGLFHELPKEILLEVASYFDTKDFLMFTTASASLRKNLIANVLDQHARSHEALAVGGDDTNTFFITRNGSLFAAGENKERWYGDGASRTSCKVYPMRVNDAPPIHSVIERTKPILLTASGRLLAPVEVTQGIFKLIKPAHQARMMPLSSEHLIIRKALYYSHGLLALTDDGNVYAMGKDASGELALGEGVDFADALTKIHNLPVIKDIVHGRNASFFITEQGRVFACGDDGFGQLGLNGDEKSVIAPKELALSGVRQICSWGGCTYFLTLAGEVYVCGKNADGQLGVGHTHQVSTPTKLDLQWIEEIHLVHGSRCVFFAGRYGELYACGENGLGQLGVMNTGGETQVLSPVLVPGVFNVASVHDAGFDKMGLTLFSQRNGDVFACGRYVNRLPGMDSVPEIIHLALEIPELKGAIAFLATRTDSDFTLDALVAVKSSGEMLAFGDNTSGYLGFGQGQSSDWQAVTFNEITRFQEREFTRPTPVSGQSLFANANKRSPEGEPPYKRARLGE